MPKKSKSTLLFATTTRRAIHLPEAVACLDPKAGDCPYPDKNLSGCGVGFKLMQAYCRYKNIDEEMLYEYLDLVAVSIASDIVPIIGENRVMAYYGLQKLNTTPSTGLMSIIKISGMEGKELTISDIVFKIGPRINAAGRIDSGRDAVALLVSSEAHLAERMSFDINVCNETRKDLDRNITLEALELILLKTKSSQKKSTVLYNPSGTKVLLALWHRVLPKRTINQRLFLTESKGFATGSARSVDGFDLYKAIDSCSDLLENFGGHMYAAGLTLKPENVPVY
jgi:single-stranded-DNA-specific exonuclease